MVKIDVIIATPGHSVMATYVKSLFMLVEVLNKKA